MRILFTSILLLYLFRVQAQEGSSNQYTSLHRQFMPELISQFPNVRDITFSPDIREMYFTIESYKKEISTIITLKKEDGKWSDPSVASFSGVYKDLEPSFSPDGLKLFFASDRPKIIF